MVAHQAIRPHPPLEALRHPPQFRAECLPSGVLQEDRRPRITTCHDVIERNGEFNPKGAGQRAACDEGCGKTRPDPLLVLVTPCSLDPLLARCPRKRAEPIATAETNKTRSAGLVALSLSSLLVCPFFGEIPNHDGRQQNPALLRRFFDTVFFKFPNHTGVRATDSIVKDTHNVFSNIGPTPGI